MLRRFFVFFFLLSFLVCFFAFPVSAASYHFSISYVDGEGYLAIVDSVPTSGTLNYNISATIVDFPGAVLSSSGSGVLIPVDLDDGITIFVLPFTFDGTTKPLQLVFASFDGQSVVGVTTVEGELESGMVLDVSLSSIEYPAFEESTSYGLGNVLSWISFILDSLINGGLVPLLSLGSLAIAISVLLLAARIIKNNSWGL